MKRMMMDVMMIFAIMFLFCLTYQLFDFFIALCPHSQPFTIQSECCKLIRIILTFVSFRWKRKSYLNAHHTQLLSHIFAYFLFHFWMQFGFWLCGFVTHIIMCPANYFKFKLYKLMGSPKKIRRRRRSYLSKKSVSGTFLYVFVGVIRFYCFLEGSKERK